MNWHLINTFWQLWLHHFKSRNQKCLNVKSWCIAFTGQDPSKIRNTKNEVLMRIVGHISIFLASLKV
jgi:hypothetical protein